MDGIIEEVEKVDTKEGTITGIEWLTLMRQSSSSGQKTIGRAGQRQSSALMNAS